MTDQDSRLQEPASYADLRTLAEQATPGPWTAVYHNEWKTWDVVDDEGEVLVGDEYDMSRSGPNAAYIAAANPQIILALLDERDDALFKAGASAGFLQAAERRVAALEEGLRALLAAEPAAGAGK